MKGGKFSKRSKGKLSQCDVKLQMLFMRVVRFYDCSVICGHRNKVDQNRAFEKGASQKKYPDSKHNLTPSQAIDVYPYPIPRLGNGEIDSNHPAWDEFVIFVKGVAAGMRIDIRCGADFSLKDKGHFELILR